MKRSVLLGIVSAVVLFTMLSVTVMSSPSRILGDLDHDDRLTSADARVMLRYLVGCRSLTAEERLLADYDGNKRINTADVRCVLRALLSDDAPVTLPTTTTTTTVTTTTRPSLDEDGYYDDIVKP